MGGILFWILGVLFLGMLLTYGVRAAFLHKEGRRQAILWPFRITARGPRPLEILLGAALLSCLVTLTVLVAGWGLLRISEQELIRSPGLFHAIAALFLSSFTFTSTYVLLRSQRRDLTSFAELLQVIQDETIRLFKLRADQQEPFDVGEQDQNRAKSVLRVEAHECRFRMVDYTPGIGSISAKRDTYRKFHRFLEDLCELCDPETGRPAVDMEIVYFDDERVRNFHSSFGREDLNGPVGEICEAIDKRHAVWTTPMIGATHLVLVESYLGACLVQYIIVPRENGQRNEIMGHVTREAAGILFARRVVDDHIRDAITPRAIITAAGQTLEFEGAFYGPFQDGDLWVEFSYPQTNVSGIRIFVAPRNAKISKDDVVFCVLNEPNIEYPEMDGPIYVRNREGQLARILLPSRFCRYEIFPLQGVPDLQLRIQLLKKSGRSSGLSNPVRLENPCTFDRMLQSVEDWGD